MDLTGLFQFLASQPLLALAMTSILLVTLGSMLLRAVPWLGRLLRGLGNLVLVASLLLAIAQFARFTNAGVDLALPQIGLPAQRVAGGETRIPLGRDGHFWLTADVNGVERRFLVDTGATLTAVSPGLAQAAGLKPQPLRQGILLRTGNGTVQAQLSTIAELRFGNVVARDLDAVIAPGLGETNVIGMNLLSRLASWRVEGRTMILVPNNPQPDLQSDLQSNLQPAAAAAPD